MPKAVPIPSMLNDPWPKEGNGATVLKITSVSTTKQLYISYIGASVLQIDANNPGAPTLRFDLQHQSAVPAYLNSLARRYIDDGDTVTIFTATSGLTLPVIHQSSTPRTARRGQVPYTPVWMNSHWGANILLGDPQAVPTTPDEDAASLLGALSANAKSGSKCLPATNPVPLPEPRVDDSRSATATGKTPPYLSFAGTRLRSPTDYLKALAALSCSTRKK